MNGSMHDTFCIFYNFSSEMAFTDSPDCVIHSSVGIIEEHNRMTLELLNLIGSSLLGTGSWRRLASVGRHAAVFVLTLRPRRALRERVAGEAARAAADWVVVAHHAFGADAAAAGARVAALLPDAGLVDAAVLVHDTLGPAVGRPVDEARQTGADGSVARHVALRVCATRARSAWIHWLGGRH